MLPRRRNLASLFSHSSPMRSSSLFFVSPLYVSRPPVVLIFARCMKGRRRRGLDHVAAAASPRFSWRPLLVFSALRSDPPHATGATCYRHPLARHHHPRNLTAAVANSLFLFPRFRLSSSSPLPNPLAQALQPPRSQRYSPLHPPAPPKPSPKPKSNLPLRNPPII